VPSSFAASVRLILIVVGIDVNVIKKGTPLQIDEFHTTVILKRLQQVKAIKLLPIEIHSKVRLRLEVKLFPEGFRFVVVTKHPVEEVYHPFDFRGVGILETGLSQVEDTVLQPEVELLLGAAGADLSQDDAPKPFLLHFLQHQPQVSHVDAVVVHDFSQLARVGEVLVAAQ
jgi:hypothetical protein